MRAFLILSLALVAILPIRGEASPTVRFSWNTCDPAIYNQDFAGPKVYTLVASGSEIPSGTYDAYEMRLWMIPGVSFSSDAWRFDAAGCQGLSGVSYSTASFSKSCPALAQGSITSTMTIDYGLPNDPANTLALQFNVNGSNFVANSSTRYALWTIHFDHSRSTTGESQGSQCGFAQLPLCVVSPHVTLFSGQASTPLHSEPSYTTTWSGDFWVYDPYFGCGYPDPTVPTTWGRLRASYR